MLRKTIYPSKPNKLVIIKENTAQTSYVTKVNKFLFLLLFCTFNMIFQKPIDGMHGTLNCIKKQLSSQTNILGVLKLNNIFCKYVI